MRRRIGSPKPRCSSSSLERHLINAYPAQIYQESKVQRQTKGQEKVEAVSKKRRQVAKKDTVRQLSLKVIKRIVINL